MNDTPGDLRPQERTDAPEHKPSGELGGHPINADETAPREHVPDAGSGPSGAIPALDDAFGQHLLGYCFIRREE